MKLQKRNLVGTTVRCGKKARRLSYFREYLKKMKEAGDVALSKVYRASLHPDYDPVRVCSICYR